MSCRSLPEVRKGWRAWQEAGLSRLPNVNLRCSVLARPNLVVPSRVEVALVLGNPPQSPPKLARPLLYAYPSVFQLRRGSNLTAYVLNEWLARADSARARRLSYGEQEDAEHASEADQVRSGLMSFIRLL